MNFLLLRRLSGTAALLAACGPQAYDPKPLNLNLTATDAVVAILPPNDLELPFTHQQLKWQLVDQNTNSSWESVTVPAEKEIRLLLSPASYRFIVNLIAADTLVASSQWGKCQQQSQQIPLHAGANTLPLMVCGNNEQAGLLENRAYLHATASAPEQTLIPDARETSFLLTQIDDDHEERNTPDDGIAVEALAEKATAAPLANVLVFGDSGTGSDDQKTTANAMLDFCRDNSCDYALMLGDNIYEHGVTSPDDPQFQSKFEDMYRPLGIPFYVALGNHDYRNHSVGIQGQIAYTNISDIWHMEDRYFKVRLGEIEYYILDTNTFSADKGQISWLRRSLKESDARWKVVYGHHPMYSVGAHGMGDMFEGFPMKRLRKTLEPILCKQGADMYFSGHDHHLEVNKSRCGVLHVISGAAAKTRATYWWAKLFNKRERLYSIGKTLGFAHMSFFTDQALLRLVDSKGKILFNKVFTHR